MKWYLLVLLFFLLCCRKSVPEDQFTETEPPVLKANVKDINEVIGGYYSALPVHYSQTSGPYPLLLFFPGAGQLGDGNVQLDLVLFESVPELVKQKLFPASFKVHDKRYSFVILIPQFKKQPTPQQVLSFVQFAKTQYNVDTARIYMTGLSEGSTALCDAAAEAPYQFAAIVPVAGESRSLDIQSKCKSISDSRLPVWLLHNDSDQIIDTRYARQFISLINGFNPPIRAKYTELLPFGLGNHDAWTHASDPGFKEDGMNIYEWMLQYHR
jgi:predicted peptidase